jgi:formate hydrogenlyase transcriptional activator
MNALLHTQSESALAERYETLFRVSQAINSHRDPSELFSTLAAELRLVINFAFIGIARQEEASGKIAWLLSECDRELEEEEPQPECAPDKTLFQFVYRSQQPLVIPSVNQETRFPPMMEVLRANGIQSACALPLTTAHRRIGILALGSNQPYTYSEEEVAFLSLVANQIAVAMDNALAYGQIAELKDRLTQEKLYLEDEIRNERNFEEILGFSPALRRVLRQVETVAPTDSVVLILGETGTGKELIARAIHNLSGRRDRTFVKLNCAAIPTGLLESELFGHEKGAFTGAISQRVGRFELANGGTIFLDEIGEIPLELQPKLLRVLQEREFERLGSVRTLRTDARFVAATNRDLAAMVEEQRFRADLFYRVNVFPVRVPSLRDRPEDIPLLVRHFAQQFARRYNKKIETIPSEILSSLSRYHWPGNVRELENVIERAVILSVGPVLKVPLSDLKERTIPSSSTKNDTLEEAERKHILSALEETRWVLGGPKGAAARLGINRSTLQFRMKKMGIARPDR